MQDKEINQKTNGRDTKRQIDRKERPNHRLQETETLKIK